MITLLCLSFATERVMSFSVRELGILHARASGRQTYHLQIVSVNRVDLSNLLLLTSMRLS